MERKFSIGEIASWVDGDFSFADENQRIENLITDSRELSKVENTLFVALKTDKNDGHKYILQLYKQGVRNFLVEKGNEYVQDLEKANVVRVDNTLAALQKIAATRRAFFDIPVIGITGSNGKTIVKEWLSQMLESEFSLVKSPKSYNSQIGVPLSVWKINSTHQMGIFEAGISHVSEMQNLEKIIRPTLGIITNIGSAHAEFFQNNRQKTMEKLSLFAHSRTLVLCNDSDDIRDSLAGLKTVNPGIQFFKWGRKLTEDLDLYIEKTWNGEGNCTHVEAVFHGQPLDLLIPFQDAASIENTLHCWATLLYMGFENEQIKPKILHLKPIAMRMEIKEGLYHSDIINDSYNSDFQSFSIALNVLQQQKTNKRTCLILSDILQTGIPEEELYSEVAKLVHEKRIDRFIGIGPALLRWQDMFKMIDERDFYADTEEFLQTVDLSTFRDSVILLKGAREFSFEKIDSILEKKVHETVLEIHLNALSHNFGYFKSKVDKDTKIMVMAKAFSYGSGSYEITKFLEFSQCDYVAVAYTDEGVDLRRKGIRMPIMVVNPEEQGIENAIRYNLETEIYNFRMMESLVQKIHSFRPDSKLKVHLKLDTGMHRLGFEEEDIEKLIQYVKGSEVLEIASVFTHLATADEPDWDEYTLEQLRKFDSWSAKIQAAFPYKILRHALNTAGIVRFPEYQFDMVRLGVGLYGVGFNPEVQRELQIASTLKTVISQIRTVKKGEAVGYSRGFVAPQDIRVGVIGIGYADGLRRSLGKGKGGVYVKGVRCPIIGNVCMDMCMIDLSNVDARERDEVIIFDDATSISRLAEDMQTISYEVLTGISPRVKRVYYRD